MDAGGKCDGQLVNNCGDFSDNWPGPPATCTSGLLQNFKGVLVQVTLS